MPKYQHLNGCRTLSREPIYVYCDCGLSYYSKSGGYDHKNSWLIGTGTGCSCGIDKYLVKDQTKELFRLKIDCCNIKTDMFNLDTKINNVQLQVDSVKKTVNELKIEVAEIKGLINDFMALMRASSSEWINNSTNNSWLTRSLDHPLANDQKTNDNTWLTRSLNHPLANDQKTQPTTHN